MKKAPETTLFVTTQGAYLAKEGETVLVRVKKEDPSPCPHPYLGWNCLFRKCSLQPFLDGVFARKRMLP